MSENQKSYYALNIAATNTTLYFEDKAIAIVNYATKILHYNWIYTTDTNGNIYLIIQSQSLVDREIPSTLVTGLFEYRDIGGWVILSNVSEISNITLNLRDVLDIVNVIVIDNVLPIHIPTTLSITNNSIKAVKVNHAANPRDFGSKMCAKIRADRVKLSAAANGIRVKLQDITGQFWPIYTEVGRKKGIIFLPDIGDDSGFWDTSFRKDLKYPSIIHQYCFNTLYPSNKIFVALESQTTHRMLATDIYKSSVILCSPRVILCAYGGYSSLLALYYSTIYPVSAIIMVNPVYTTSYESTTPVTHEIITKDLKFAMQSLPPNFDSWNWIQNIHIPILVFGGLSEPLKSHLLGDNVKFTDLATPYPHLIDKTNFTDTIQTFMSNLKTDI